MPRFRDLEIQVLMSFAGNGPFEAHVHLYGGEHTARVEMDRRKPGGIL